MDDLQRVRGLQRPGDLHADVDGARAVQAAPLEELGEGAPPLADAAAADPWTWTDVGWPATCGVVAGGVGLASSGIAVAPSWGRCVGGPTRDRPGRQPTRAFVS